MGGKEHGRWRGRSDERVSWGIDGERRMSGGRKEGKGGIEGGRERDEQTGGKREGAESIFSTRAQQP